MPEVRPFRGLRYDPDRAGPLEYLLTGPYDIITPEQQAADYARHPYNVIRLEFGQEQPDDTPENNRYTRAAATLAEWLRLGLLRPDPTPALYLLEETFPEAERVLSRRSLIAAVRLAEWEEGVVYPHERTMPRPKADRLALLRACRTQFSPVLALARGPLPALATVAERVTATPPVATLAFETVTVPEAAPSQRLWAITDRTLQDAVVSALADQPLFIADGHHRYETALAYRAEQRARHGLNPQAPWEFVLMHIVESTDPGLVIRPTHRLVEGAPPAQVAALLQRAAGAGSWTVEPLPTADLDRWLPERLRALAARVGQPTLAVFGLDGDRLRLGPLQAPADWDGPPTWRTLDVGLLQVLVLDPLLGAGAQVTYTRDAAEAVARVRAGSASVAFLLKPVEVASVIAVALAGDRMPPKSTYFYPKPLTGLVMFAHDLAWP